MRTGAAAGTVGHFHEAMLFDTDDQFVDALAPFILEGSDAGEPVLVVATDANRQRLEDAVGSDTFIALGRDAHFATPAAAIAGLISLLENSVASGAEQVRVIGEVPHPAFGRRWDQWARYESAINKALEPFPLWTLCPYDTRLIDGQVRSDVLATHRYLATSDGRHVRNLDYVEPLQYLASRIPTDEWSEPTPPVTTMSDPTPRQVRGALGHVAAHLSDSQRGDLLIAVSEIVSNATIHGVAPVSVILWNDDLDVLVEVSERGPGPSQALRGFHPLVSEDGLGGRGLWIAAQLCEIEQRTTATGHATRLRKSPR